MNCFNNHAINFPFFPSCAKHHLFIISVPIFPMTDGATFSETFTSRFLVMCTRLFNLQCWLFCWRHLQAVYALLLLPKSLVSLLCHCPCPRAQNFGSHVADLVFELRACDSLTHFGPSLVCQSISPSISMSWKLGKWAFWMLLCCWGVLMLLGCGEWMEVCAPAHPFATPRHFGTLVRWSMQM